MKPQEKVGRMPKPLQNIIIVAISKKQCRSYRLCQKKSLTEPPSGLKEHFSKPIERTQNGQTCAGLPVLFTYPTKYPSDFYINGNNGMVEHFTKEGILQTMRIDTYERKYLGRDENICYGVVI